MPKHTEILNGFYFNGQGQWNIILASVTFMDPSKKTAHMHLVSYCSTAGGGGSFFPSQPLTPTPTPTPPENKMVRPLRVCCLLVSIYYTNS